MKRRNKWVRRIGIFLAPVLAASTTIAVDSANASDANTTSDDDNDTIGTASTDGEFSLCRPFFGEGKFIDYDAVPISLTIEGTDGKPLTDLTGVTFEVSDGSTVVNVTDSIVPMTDSMIDMSSFMDDFFDQPTSNYYEPFTAPGVYHLGCSSQQFVIDTWELRAFPDGSVITAKRGGTTVATAPLGGRIPSPFYDNEFLRDFQNVQPDPDRCFIGVGSVQAATDIPYCTYFTDVYNLLTERTGTRLHPSFAYFATVFPSILMYAILQYELYDDDVPWFWGPIFGPTATSQLSTQLSSRLASLPSLKELETKSNDEIRAAVPAFTWSPCIASRLLAVIPIREPVGDQLPVFEITNIGHGLAASLSDPSVKSWPELDLCISDAAFNPVDPDDPTFEEYFSYMIGLAAVSAVFELYVYQLLYFDIPMGKTKVSVSATSSMRTVEMQSLTRIPWEWKDNTLAAPRVGKKYSDGVSANGTPVATYSVTSGALPKGLTLNPTTGAITGKAKRQGNFTFTITATNSAGSMSHPFTMNVKQIRPRLTASREELVVSFSGRVSPELRGKKVELQVFKYGAWRTVMPIEVKKNGRFTATTFTKWVQNYRVVAGNARSLVVKK